MQNKKDRSIDIQKVFKNKWKKKRDQNIATNAKEDDEVLLERIHPISAEISKYFESGNISRRPSTEVDSLEAMKSRTWVFFMVLLQVSVNVLYVVLLSRLHPSDVIMIFAIVLVLYYFIKVLSLLLFLLRNLNMIIQCFWWNKYPLMKYDEEKNDAESIFVCIPLYNENKRTIAKNIESLFQSHYPKSKLFAFFIVDGNKSNTYERLMNELEQKITASDENNSRVTLKHGIYKEKLAYSVYVKNANKGRRDSQFIAMDIISSMDPNKRPDYLMFLEGDTYVTPNTIELMARKLRKNKNCGGVCGKVLISNFEYLDYKWDNILFNFSTLMILGFQHYQYKFDQIFVKGFESAYGSVKNPTSALIMYKISALQAIISRKGKKGKNIRPDIFSRPISGIMERNRYELGQDGVIASSLLSKGFRFHYEPNGVAYTYCPNLVVELLQQRKRWNNANFFHSFAFISKGRSWTSYKSMVVAFCTLMDFMGAYVLPANAILVLVHVWQPLFTFVNDTLGIYLSVQEILFWWLTIQLVIISTTDLSTSDMFFVLMSFFPGLIMAFSAYFFLSETIIPIVTDANIMKDWATLVLVGIFPILHLFVSLLNPTAMLSAISYWLMFPTVNITIPIYSWLHYDDYNWGK